MVATLVSLASSIYAAKWMGAELVLMHTVISLIDT